MRHAHMFRNTSRLFRGALIIIPQNSCTNRHGCLALIAGGRFVRQQREIPTDRQGISKLCRNTISVFFDPSLTAALAGKYLMIYLSYKDGYNRVF